MYRLVDEQTFSQGWLQPYCTALHDWLQRRVVSITTISVGLLTPSSARYEAALHQGIDFILDQCLKVADTPRQTRSDRPALEPVRSESEHRVHRIQATRWPLWIVVGLSPGG